MNKLRELIDAYSRFASTGNYFAINDYLVCHKYEIADLIDAAQKCSLMSCGSVDECVANLHLLDAALKKLEK